MQRSNSMNERSRLLITGIQDILPDMEQMYMSIHSNPELSMQEYSTANLISKKLNEYGFEVITGIGKTGVVGVLQNGDGPTVMARADMDALPVREDTGLPYASKSMGTDADGKAVPVMHACGHDMHVAWLLGTALLYSKYKNEWHGTLITVFQPAEEIAAGSRAMIEDGLFKKIPRPDVVLGQHVMVGSSGVVGWRAGVITSTADSLEIKMFGRGAHGSMPQSSIDPVIMAASTVLRLQTIVSREVSPSDFAVLTIGALQAGNKDNVIPDEAILKLNIRTLDENIRKHILSAVERIVNAEASASNATKKPEIRELEHYSLVKNDPVATEKVVGSFKSNFQAGQLHEAQPTSASEDFGNFGTEIGAPSVFWFVGGTDPDKFAEAEKNGTVGEIPTNHNPHFAPVIHPTLESGIKAMVSAAGAWLFS